MGHGLRPPSDVAFTVPVRPKVRHVTPATPARSRRWPSTSPMSEPSRCSRPTGALSRMVLTTPRTTRRGQPARGRRGVREYQGNPPAPRRPWRPCGGMATRGDLNSNHRRRPSDACAPVSIVSPLPGPRPRAALDGCQHAAGCAISRRMKEVPESKADRDRRLTVR